MLYTVNEGGSVEVCAIITVTDSTVTATLLGVDGSAIGRNSSLFKWGAPNQDTLMRMP